MRLIVDIMSGDNAPLATLQGLDRAAHMPYGKDVEYILTGDESVIKKVAEENNIVRNGR